MIIGKSLKISLWINACKISRTVYSPPKLTAPKAPPKWWDWKTCCLSLYKNGSFFGIKKFVHFRELFPSSPVPTFDPRKPPAWRSKRRRYSATMNLNLRQSALAKTGCFEEVMVETTTCLWFFLKTCSHCTSGWLKFIVPRTIDDHNRTELFLWRITWIFTLLENNNARIMFSAAPMVLYESKNCGEGWWPFNAGCLLVCSNYPTTAIGLSTNLKTEKTYLIVVSKIFW